MKPTLLTLAILSVSILGCSKTAPADDSSAPLSTAQQTTDSVPTKTAIKNAPDASAAPGAGYRIQPANPNDPHFKPDPKLAGGN